MGRWILLRLVSGAMLLLPAAAYATSLARGSIHEYAALSGKFAFVQPDGSLTVLDSGTGKVLFRGQARALESYSWNSFFDTPHGLVVRSYRWKLIGRDESVYRMVDFKPQTIVWEVASRHDCHVGEDYLICPDWLGRLVVRQLADGKELWSYRPERATGEILDSKGRVMVSAHDEDRRWRDRGDGSKVFDSRYRIHSIAILDGRTGKEILAARGLGIDVAPVSYGTSAFSFDGTHVVVDVLSPGGRCVERVLRTFTVNAAATGFTSEDQCAPADKSWERSAAFYRIDKEIGGDRSALVERDGKVFVDGAYFRDGPGLLQCLDVKSGHLLWSYAFPRPTRTPLF
jgi:outer membrane protein assembly factor BamB